MRSRRPVISQLRDVEGGPSGYQIRRGERVLALVLVLLAVALRLRNALRYPPDWGFDATYNWQYILHLSLHWSLPRPDVAWSTGTPPLYFALGAALLSALRALGRPGLAPRAIPLLSTAVGLVIVGLAAALVRRVEPGNERRAWLAALLLLYLPAHFQMSLMVNPEILSAAWISLALFLLAAPRAEAAVSTGRAAAVGLASGLAWLTKLTGVLAVAVAAATWVLEAARARRPRAALRPVAVLVLVAVASGGWFYLRNRIEFGYFQPFGLPAHRQMFRMPPGQRGLADYVRVPLATFTDPQLLDPDLLHSVWGSTYATAWFDGHRFLLPRHDLRVTRLGTATLLLALLPTLAFAVGALRAARRAARTPGSPDLPLLLLVGAVLAGYALYTWKNPWFVAVKGTSLLALSLPFACFASEVLDGWLRRRAGPVVAAALLALAACAAASSTFDGLFAKTEVSGLRWEAPAPPGAAPGLAAPE